MQVRKKLYDIYSEKSLTERQYWNWFARFRSRDFLLKDAPRSGRPTEVFYCRQLMKLDKEFKEKRPDLATRKGVIFHQDNARSHTVEKFDTYKCLLSSFL